MYVRVCEGQLKRQNTCTGAYIHVCPFNISFMLVFFGDVLMFMITKNLYHFGFLSGRKDNSGYRLNKIAVHVM